MGKLNKKRKQELEKLESDDTKYCTKCKIVKPLYEFNIKSNGHKMACPHCLECVKEDKIFRDFGITLKDYDELLEKQGRKCKICGTTEIGNKTIGRFHVDHDHKTGKIRGLLCSKCNLLLGHAKDNPETLIAAAHYLMNSRK